MLFNNQYSLINSNILESLQEGFSDSFKSLKLIINNNKLLVKFRDKNSILIGTLNDGNNNIFIPEQILKYNTSNLMNKHFKEFEKNEFNGHEQTLNIDKKIDDLKDKENNNLGKLYKIDKNKYININIKNNNNDNQNTIKDMNEIKKSTAYKINIKPNIGKFFDSCKKQKENDLEPNPNNKLNNININNNYFNYPNNNINQKQKDEINPQLEKDIKIIIKYILFHSQLEKDLKTSKNGFYKIIPNCYLINHAWMQTYQFYLFYNDLKKLVETESQHVTPMPLNNMKKEKENIYPVYLINVIYSKFIKNFSSTFESENIKKVKWNFENKKCEIPTSNEPVRDSYVKYPSIFEIVDENIYKDLLNRNGNKMENEYSKTNIIINDGNIIIKCDEIHKKEKTNLIILIGYLERDKSFHLTFLLNFKGEEKETAYMIVS
jgi:hypothetical protein